MTLKILQALDIRSKTGQRAGTTMRERFWSYVEVGGPDDCWEWQGTLTPHGYGHIRLGDSGPLRHAHRISWVIHYGVIPIGEGHHGTCVLHRCDNRKCVNPSHLFLGSSADNIADMIKKGRRASPQSINARKGEEHWGHKLSNEEVLEIRRLFRSGNFTCQKLADRFGIHRSEASRIVHRKRWGHI